MRFDHMHAVLIILCALCFALGITVGVRAVYEEEPSCNELSNQLVPYRHCLQQGGLCNTNVDFFIEYYDIKWALETRCPEPHR